MIASGNGHHPVSAWRTATVQAFFAQVPWEGAPQVELFGQTDQVASPAMPMFQQTVGEFFQRFPWDGTPEIAAPVLPLSVQPNPTETSDNLTLDDFSSLF
ncbi:MAG: hypothetical protein ACFB0C_20190 [Leptolyngbyaceae cyanobacterium]